ncbi:family 16 glycosylhydrolase [Pseudoroseicyclus aestuarii]|uniref:Glycosyl hydrolase family 16 n=1 Tax=Pseudoroseicyclus aestuarii TaxID=1795041 RepID=A0A318SSM4_9RHOB|nr:family 16 glycosylhydrolase [Pseudoroseicyclus aestuarii]PYE81396.1 glycosyl hydrolase family 16 [Pseudoroseicyclus aestuarii]
MTLPSRSLAAPPLPRRPYAGPETPLDGLPLATGLDAPESSPPQRVVDGRTYTLAFGDEFDAPDPARFWAGFGKGGVWTTSFSPHLDDTRSIAANNELQHYIDPDAEDLPNPFTVQDGSLMIRATPLTPEQQALSGGQPYGSGMISSELSHSMRHGFIELRADVPDERGLWSAFWLLPSDGDWSAEVDLAEVLGGEAGTLHQNVWESGDPDASLALETGAGTGFHTYGLHWTETHLQWYFDGELVRETEAVIDEDMYLILNLAVGGWAEIPDDSTDFSDGLRIDYVRVYVPDESGGCGTALPLQGERGGGTLADDVLNGSRWGDVLNGLAGEDRIFGKGGGDRITGGSGVDRLFGQEGQDALLGGAGADHLVGGTGEDRLQGGTGTDHIWGGSYGADGARDVFVFAPGDGRDYIHDFEPGLDVIELAALAADPARILAHAEDKGWALRLDLAAAGAQEGDALYLAGVSAAQLGAESFQTGPATLLS